MRQAVIGVLILSALGLGSAFAQTANPPAVNGPAQSATPDDRRADALRPHDGVIAPAPGASADKGATVHPPNVDPGINVAPPVTGGAATVTPK